eukprot:scaffold8224_cov118-Isochrysis_galbana.AAC.12
MGLNLWRLTTIAEETAAISPSSLSRCATRRAAAAVSDAVASFAAGGALTLREREGTSATARPPHTSCASSGCAAATERSAPARTATSTCQAPACRASITPSASARLRQDKRGSRVAAQPCRSMAGRSCLATNLASPSPLKSHTRPLAMKAAKWASGTSGAVTNWNINSACSQWRRYPSLKLCGEELHRAPLLLWSRIMAASSSSELAKPSSVSSGGGLPSASYGKAEASARVAKPNPHALDTTSSLASRGQSTIASRS